MVKKGTIVGIVFMMIGMFFLIHPFFNWGESKNKLCQKTRLCSRQEVEVAKSQNENDTKQISAIIVPHHDLMKDSREELLAKIEHRQQYKKIIVASTDHFNAASNSIVTSDQNWKLAEGVLSAEQKSINGIVSSGLVKKEDSSLAGDHGITNILSDVKKYFPDSQVIPLMIKSEVDKTTIDELSLELEKSCNDCLMIASVDFSHYQLGSLAELHDNGSLRAIETLDSDMIWKAETDSDQVLSLAINWAQNKNTLHFKLFENTNSGKLTNSRDAESTSYILGWFEKGEVIRPSDSTTFIFGGDMMFGRSIDYAFQGEKLKDVMSNLGNRFFWGTDLAMANLEGPISLNSFPPTNDKNSMVFRFQPETANVLSWLGINAVGLANNHTLNQGKDGLENTKQILATKNIATVGEDRVFNDQSIKIFGSGETKVAVIAVDLLDTDDSLTGKISELKKANNFVVVYPHWGIEYDTVHSVSQGRTAHDWIDAGADMVVGSHPHVVQDAEIYKGKPVFYSLGNFLFDQDFSKATQVGLVLAGKIEKDSISLVLIPIKSVKYKPQVMIGEERTAMLANFRHMLSAPEIEKNYGYDKIILEH